MGGADDGGGQASKRTSERERVLEGEPRDHSLQYCIIRIIISSLQGFLALRCNGTILKRKRKGEREGKKAGKEISIRRERKEKA